MYGIVWWADRTAISFTAQKREEKRKRTQATITALKSRECGLHANGDSSMGHWYLLRSMYEKVVKESRPCWQPPC